MKFMQSSPVLFFAILFFLLPTISNAMQAMKLLSPNTVFIPSRLGKTKLYYDKGTFKILQKENLHTIKSYDLDPLLRNISDKKLEVLLQHGYIDVSQFDNGDFSLRTKIRGLGGGPATAAALYWITKTVCYGTALAGAGTAVVTTGGTIAVAGSALVGIGLGASAGAGAVAGVIASTGLGTEAALATTAVVSGMGVAGAVAAIEGAATTAAALGFWLPLP